MQGNGYGAASVRIAVMMVRSAHPIKIKTRTLKGFHARFGGNGGKFWHGGRERNYCARDTSITSNKGLLYASVDSMGIGSP